MANVLSPAQAALPTAQEVRALLTRSAAGDESVRPEVCKLLENPAFIGIFGGELVEQAEAGFIASLFGKDVAFREATLKKLGRLRADLLGENPTAVERLLVERIAACWLQVQHAELRYVNHLKDMTMPQGDYHQRRMDATHRRFLSAVKALALVRKLALPALQVNIARRQVNVVTPAAVTVPAAG